MWLLFAFASAFFAGATAILAKVGLKDTDSTLATAIRTVVVLLFSWLVVLMAGSQRQLAQLDGYSLLFLVLSGLATGASWLCYFKALQLGDVNRVAPLDKSSTIMTILLAALILGETLTPAKVAGIVLIALGTWLMTVKKADAAARSPRRKNSWFVFALLSAVFASLTAILGKIGIQNIESNLGTAIRTVVVLVMAWGMVFLSGNQRDIAKIDKKSWLFLLFSGVTTGLSWLCYYHALQEGQAGIVVPIDKLSIVVTVVFSSVFLKEKLTGKALLGLVSIVAGTLVLLV